MIKDLLVKVESFSRATIFQMYFQTSEAPVSNYIDIVIPSMSTDTFQGVASPEVVIFISWYSSVASSCMLFMAFCDLPCRFVFYKLFIDGRFSTSVANCFLVLAR